MKKSQYVLIALVLIIAIAIIATVSNKRNVADEVPENPSESIEEGEQNPDVIEGVEFILDDDTTVEGTLTKIIPPTFDTPLPEDIDEDTLKRLEKLKKDLDANADNFSAWIEIGLIFKGIKDHESAAKAWEFAQEVRPESSLPNANLATLYGWHLKDEAKAKENFAVAIEKEPTNMTIYGQAYEYYMVVLEDRDSAVEIYKEGYEVTQDGTMKAFLEQIGEL